MRPQYNVTRSSLADQTEILELLSQAKRENLSLEERDKYGFIQGAIDAKLLTKFQSELGVYIIRDKNEIVAAGFTSKVGILDEGPIAIAAATVFSKERDLQPAEVFQYGPVVVKRGFKGKGLLTQLLLFLCSEVGGNFKKGLAFVEEANKVSLAIHRHYFEQEWGTFTFNERLYYIFLFDPKDLIEKYKM